MRFSTFIFAFLISLTNAYAWTLEDIKGSVTLEAKGKKSAAVKGTVLDKGFAITTAKDGRALIRDGESMVWVGSDSKFVIHSLANEEEETQGRLDVEKGRVRAKFKRPGGPVEFPYTMKAKSVVASVRGTEFIVAVEGPIETVMTLEGLVRVQVLKGAESWDVPAAKHLSIKPREMPKVNETAADMRKAWLESTSL